MTRKRHSPEAIQRAVEMRECGKSIMQIVRATGMSRGAVYWHCLKLGADLPDGKKHPVGLRGPEVVTRGDHQVRRFSADEDEKLLRWAAEGVSRCEMGRRLGRPHNSVIGRLMTLARHSARQEELS
ncbi:helix-turn-helix resolvase-like protein [Salipiger aestuarii]|uniref:Helix-turn-helix resolvase-like protein n=1 Tax=Salipiger aestuarii TaxID=568098 RepID=A0A327YSL0_9RHOB|nr:helix-turn-helix domain-containing protein [Salipiger aestuarii]RAK24078.1 helix-turn-helix resolvase-like protein [Salipiger aestuarii]